MGRPRQIPFNPLVTPRPRRTPPTPFNQELDALDDLVEPLLGRCIPTVWREDITQPIEGPKRWYVHLEGTDWGAHGPWGSTALSRLVDKLQGKIPKDA